MLRYAPLAPPWSVAAEYRRHGLPLRQANTQRVAGWAALASALGDPGSGVQPKLFIHASCTRLIQAIPALQQDPSKPEDVMRELPDEDGSGGDAAAEALRYLVATPRVSIGAALA